MATASTKKAKYSKLDEVPINPGIQVLYPNPDEPLTTKASSKIGLDIIGIPGLGANPEWTWVREKVHWLRDGNMLARRVPNARISVFQYQNQWFGRGSVDQRVENVADQLLYHLERSRGDNNKTPIIFVCHCLGGIVLEKALVTARLRQNDFPSIFPYVAGCVFLGTPFHGTKSQSKAMVLAEMAETIGMGAPSSLLKLLEKDSEVLGRMLDDFVRLSHEAQIRVFCFFESKKSDVAALFLKGIVPIKSMELIVDKESATYPGVESLQLVSDHFSLNKFTGPKDGNFISVSNEIKVTAQKAPGIIKSRQNALRQALINDRTYHALIDTLGKGFADLETAVKGSYKGPKGGKQSWVAEVECFKQWKEHQLCQLIWIHGKAGTGQDLIASSVIETLNKTREQGSIVVSFFCDQADENRRSLRGMLKILVRQMIDLNQDLAVHLLTDSKKTKTPGKQDFDPEALSRVNDLWDALQAMAKDTPGDCLYIVVHGLDQLSQESLAAFLEYVKQVPDRGSQSVEESDVSPIKWMLLSRSGRPDIEKVLKLKAHEIDIDASENSGYVSDALRADISAQVDHLGLSAPLTYFVKRHIHARALDNSVYVKLVIQELKNAMASGLTKHAEIRSLLESFPYGLTDMFEHIRKRVLKPDAEGIEYTKEILRSLILAQRAPTMRELAIMADLPYEDRDDHGKLKEYLIRCGAFVSLRGNDLDEDSMTIGWIDNSAKLHLEKFAKEELALELKDMQHGIIALRCLEYTYSITEKYAHHTETNAIDEDSASSDDEDRISNTSEAHEQEQTKMAQRDSEGHPPQAPTANRTEASEQTEEKPDELDAPATEVAAPTIGYGDAEEHEFDEDDVLQYPIQYWLEHAKLAPVDVIEEFRTSHAFWKDDSPSRQDWWSENESMHPLSNQTNVSALHVATIAEFPAFVDHLLNHGWTEDTHKEDSLGYQPLYYACASGNYEIVQTLLGAGADINFVSEEGRVPALYAAAEYGHLDIVECLLDRDADINANCDQYGSALYIATQSDHMPVMKLLIERGADVNLVGGAGRRALNIAAWNGNLDAIRLLIEHGADIDPDEEYWYGSAVGTASRRGHADIVKFLLSKGWSPNKTMRTYGSFLTCASTYGHVSIVEILVQKEARITVLEQALAAASQNGKAAVVKIILDKTPTLRHQKAFMLAADYGRDEVLKLLQQRGMPQGNLNEALYLSADHEHESTVELLLEFGADPNADGPTYGCALTASAYDGTKGIMKALIEKGADVNKHGGDYGYPLQAAAWFGNADNVRLLLEHGARVNTDPVGIYGSALQAACETGDEDTIRLLIEHGADVNAEGGEYGYPIIAAVDQGDSDTLRILLEHNADVSVRGGEDNMPVIVLAGGTLVKEDVEAILDHGADVNAVCDEGTTALINCADAGDPDGLKFLLSRGADIHVSSKKWGTALHISCARGDAECCEVLIKAGADVNTIGGPFGTSLQAACGCPDIDTVRLLLDAGADATGLETVAGDFGTPLQAACASDDIDIVRLLIEHGAVVNLQPPNGKYGYPLHAACAEGSYEIVDLLLEHSADVNLEGGLHSFALISAAQAGASNIVQLLFDHGACATVAGGLLGSVAAAAAFSNQVPLLDLVISHGADVHAKGGKYGSALCAAAVKASDMGCIDLLLSKGVDVNHRGGKYHTALIAAAYFDRQDVVSKLLDHGADFRFRGGKFGSAVAAAAIRGNKSILEKLLKMGPPEQLLDEALAEACAHRQATSVELLLKSGANVYARHFKLGTPQEAMKAEKVDGYNSDEEIEDANEDSDDDDDDDDDNDSDSEDEEWQGDGNSVAAVSEQGSVMDLQLEDEESEESKIEKLLNEAMERVKRNPSVQRFRTVKRRQIPTALTAGRAPQLPTRTSYQQLDSANNTTPYAQKQYANLDRQSFQAYHGSAPEGISYPQGYPPLSGAGYAPYRTSIVETPSGFPPNQQRPGGYAKPPAGRQYSAGSNADITPSLPPRSASQDKLSQRYSTQVPPRKALNSSFSDRYQQQQSPHPSYSGPDARYSQPPLQQGFATPFIQNPYSSPPQPIYASPPTYSTPVGQPFGGPQYQLPVGQDTAYIPYHQQSNASSQTSFQTSQYGSSIQHFDSQQSTSSTPNSSQTSWFSGQGQGKK